VSTRHHRAGRDEPPEAFIERDLLTELARRGLPQPCRVKVANLRNRGARLEGKVELVFAHPLHGPLLLGHGSHRGQGLFVGAGAEETTGAD
jgi:CRISPR-associated protein Csb2